MTKGIAQFAKRMANFPGKSTEEKRRSYVYRWRRWLPGIPPPIRLRTGAWWLLDTDFIGASLLNGGYEYPECEFEKRFVKPGMTVLDIGAHRGFHTLLLSKKVGGHGHVLAIEPSPYDLKRLSLHLRINFCRNVEVIECALGEEEGTSDLYVVPTNSVLNSLRPPDTQLQTSATRVKVRKLDDLLSQAHIDKVDFVKLDVEGAELGVLKGAERLLSTIPRPVLLCEVLEQRTRPWEYTGRIIIEYLSEREFVWFMLNERGGLLPVPRDLNEFGGNFVAIPRESLPSAMNLYAPVP